MRDIYKSKNSFKKFQSVNSQLIISGKVDEPDITVFIPTYKRVDTLLVSINSVINQIGEYNYEMIIINNDPEGKDDVVKKMIEKLENDRIYYYVNERNIGLCGNWNRGFELARGEYVTMLHDDDVLSPWFFESLFSVIKTKKSPDIVGVSFVPFDSKKMPLFKKPNELKSRVVTKNAFFWGDYINITGMTIKKASIIKTGGFAQEYYPNEDSIFIYQTLLNGVVINIESVLAGYRQEVNLSLSGDTLKDIIIKVEYTRRWIAWHERFARVWMTFFDKEYLYNYIDAANKNWKTNISYKEIFMKVGINSYHINKIKYAIMKILLIIAIRRNSV